MINDDCRITSKGVVGVSPVSKTEDDALLVNRFPE